MIFYIYIYTFKDYVCGHLALAGRKTGRTEGVKCNKVQSSLKKWVLNLNVASLVK